MTIKRIENVPEGQWVSETAEEAFSYMAELVRRIKTPTHPMSPKEFYQFELEAAEKAEPIIREMTKIFTLYHRMPPIIVRESDAPQLLRRRADFL